MNNYIDANINAAGLLLVIIVTAVLLWKFGTKPKSLCSVLFAVIAFFFFELYLGPRVSYRAHDGVPLFQLLIPGFCLVLLLIFIDKAILKILMVIFLFSAAFLLANNYQALRRSGLYTGASDLSEHVLKRRKHIYYSILFPEAETDNHNYPPGWLRESLAAAKSKRIQKMIAHLKEEPLHDLKAVYLWHSWFTGIYGKKEGGLIGVWYPGGTLKEAADKIEFKPI